MKISIGSDHAAFDSKQEISEFLRSLAFEVIDHGCYDNQSCDYPDFAAAVSRAILNGESDKGLLICGTGIGMSIAANRYPGIRAALCYTPELAELSRRHNDANVLCMGARTQSVDDMKKILQVWLETDWDGDRHARRLEKIESNPRG